MLKAIDGAGRSPARPWPGATAALMPPDPIPHLQHGDPPPTRGSQPHGTAPRHRSVADVLAGGGRGTWARIRAFCAGLETPLSHCTAQPPRAALPSSVGLIFCFKGLGRLGVSWGCCGMQAGYRGCGHAPNSRSHPQECQPVVHRVWGLRVELPHAWPHTGTAVFFGGSQLRELLAAACIAALIQPRGLGSAPGTAREVGTEPRSHHPLLSSPHRASQGTHRGKPRSNPELVHDLLHRARLWDLGRKLPKGEQERRWS